MIEITQWRAAIGIFNHAARNAYFRQHAVVHDQNITDRLHDELSTSKHFRSDSCGGMLCVNLIHFCTHLVLHFLVLLIFYIILSFNIDSPLTVITVFCGSAFQVTLTQTTENNLLLMVMFTLLQLVLSGDVDC